MSTKTSLLKRISQTAVVALVGGLVSLVSIPASNAVVDGSFTGTCVARSGVGAVINITPSSSQRVSRTAGTANATGNSVVYRVKEIARTANAGAAADTTNLQTGMIVSGFPETGSASLSIPIPGESITVGLATITYSVWTDNNIATDDGSAPGAESASRNITCTVAGAPASFTLSATTGSIAAGETATFTITPKDSAGNTTLLVESVTATNPALETFTVTANSATANGVSMFPGKFASGTSFSASAKLGAGYVSTYSAARIRAGQTDAIVVARSIKEANMAAGLVSVPWLQQVQRTNSVWILGLQTRRPLVHQKLLVTNQQVTLLVEIPLQQLAYSQLMPQFLALARPHSPLLVDLECQALPLLPIP